MQQQVRAQNHLQIEESLKIIAYKGRETPAKEVIINQTGTRMVEDGED